MWDGVGACGRVWEYVARVVAGCGGMWQGWRYVVRVRPMALMGHVVGVGAYGRVWGHVAGCGHMWQGMGACGRDGDTWHGGHVAGIDTCSMGTGCGIDGGMW